MRIAIDTGGTFTDCVYLKEGVPAVLKVPSTPDDPTRSVLEAIRQIASQDSVEVRHGTTIGTNALLERKGARVAFVTTAGFEDTIAIGRQARQHLYDWMATPAPCIVPKELRFGVRERISAEGEILLAPSEQELLDLRERIAASGAESVAISLLFSFANQENERRVAVALREIGKSGVEAQPHMPDLPISISHEILPEFREYERAATVVVNAYLAPKAGAYVRRLENAIQNDAVGSDVPCSPGHPRARDGSARRSIYVMQSSGGIISAKLASEEPVRTVLSGPAGGVIGAHRVAQIAGFEKIISFDMGGTSTDVALIDTRGPQITNESRISEIPISVPMLDIHTVGAGGGSLAWFDRGGILHAGPQSAGAEPGPICYGRGEQPTVTDANLALNRLDPELALAGTVRLDQARTRKFMEKSRGPLSSVEQFATGIIQVAEAEMEKAIRLISVERGHDPREFILVAFGGAGPLHACSLARDLGIPRVMVPAMPGALSALGILGADVVRDYSRTVMMLLAESSGTVQKGSSANSAQSLRPLRLKAFDRRKRKDSTQVAEKNSKDTFSSDADISSALEVHFAELEARGAAEFQSAGLAGTSIRSADLRYLGQGYEINVPVGPEMLASFHDAHRNRYGHADENRRVEVVNVRVRIVAASETIDFPRQSPDTSGSDHAVLKKREVMFGKEWIDTPVLDRNQLLPGNAFWGPAIVHEYSATTVVAPGCKARVDLFSNLIIEV
jgi:N-methylhydantoinase A